jgi:hypothetical protein
VSCHCVKRLLGSRLLSGCRAVFEVVWVSRGKKLTAKALRRGVVRLRGLANRRKLLEVTPSHASLMLGNPMHHSRNAEDQVLPFSWTSSSPKARSMSTRQSHLCMGLQSAAVPRVEQQSGGQASQRVRSYHCEGVDNQRYLVLSSGSGVSDEHNQYNRFPANIKVRTRSGPMKRTSRLLRRPSQSTEAATNDTLICRWYGRHAAYGKDTERRLPPLSNSMSVNCEHHRKDAPVVQERMIPAIKMIRPGCVSAGQTATQEP